MKAYTIPGEGEEDKGDDLESPRKEPNRNAIREGAIWCLPKLGRSCIRRSSKE